MRLLMGLLSILTVGGDTTAFLVTQNSNKAVNSNTEQTINDYEAMDRAVLNFGTKVDQSYFDKKSGITYWTGEFNWINKLARTKIKSDYSGFDLHTAVDSSTNGAINMENQTIFYGNESEVYYNSEKRISKFSWSPSNDTSYNDIEGLNKGIGDHFSPADVSASNWKGQQTVLVEINSANSEIIHNVVFSEKNNAVYYSLENPTKNTWSIKKFNIATKDTETIIEEKYTTTTQPVLAVSNDSDSGIVYYIYNGYIIEKYTR